MRLSASEWGQGKYGMSDLRLMEASMQSRNSFGTTNEHASAAPLDGNALLTPSSTATPTAPSNPVSTPNRPATSHTPSCLTTHLAPLPSTTITPAPAPLATSCPTTCSSSSHPSPLASGTS